MERTTRRSIQAAGTREVIVDSAGRLFATDGYVRTTIDGIAAESGVAVQTVYNSVGNKAALLSAVLDNAAAGPGAQAGVLELMRERTRQAGDFEALIGVLADWFAEVHPRTAAITAVIAQAAAVDDTAARLEKDRGQQRLRRYAEAAAAARTRGGLSSGMSDAEAAAAIWSLGHPQVYRAVVQDAGWSVPAYRDWVAKALAAALG
ncbi:MULTISPECIES: TetR/AcrR family transcriptional regulator [unclassified Arthrobacter]|uniref:TetR/AcrR family transcriptional regulator n=1 Tax=unclassified Arthrobacter TaxID=235627 RepID=UPI002E01B365|nr:MULTISPECIES: TetR/AcrR family transcriptional regulator [unclassified Arthrobacter]MEC5189966.1 AcrR family transcriptional regulator [Arthrobacter sp. MP_M4]MEC5201434.1 AcrR family transcriptional regulator [Arthrobacter sp. MP_M7]